MTDTYKNSRKFDKNVELEQKKLDLMRKITVIPEETNFNGSITIHYNNGKPQKLDYRIIEKI